MGNVIVQMIHSMGYFGVFLAMTLESACIPLPSEIIMPFGGYLASTGRLNLSWVILLGTLGNVSGSLIAYYIGKAGGRTLVMRYGRYVLLSEKHLSITERWFAKRGIWVVLIARVLPIVRTFISLPAGIGKMKVFPFICFTAVGCLPWVASLAYVGYKLGQNWDNIKHFTHPITYAVAILLILCIMLPLYRIVTRKLSHANNNQ